MTHPATYPKAVLDVIDELLGPAGNSGALQWGDAYRVFHRDAWDEARRVLKPGGRFILNIKDHIRGGKRQHVTGWHLDVLTAIGFRLVTQREVPVPGIRVGRNADARIGFETVARLAGRCVD